MCSPKYEGKKASHKHFIFPELDYMKTFLLVIALGIREVLIKTLLS